NRVGLTGTDGKFGMWRCEPETGQLAGCCCRCQKWGNGHDGASSCGKQPAFGLAHCLIHSVSCFRPAAGTCTGQAGLTRWHATILSFARDENLISRHVSGLADARKSLVLPKRSLTTVLRSLTIVQAIGRSAQFYPDEGRKFAPIFRR